MTVLLATGVLAAAGCGDDDEGEPSGSTQAAPAETQAATQTDAEAPTAGGGSSEAVSLTDFAIDPANPKLKAGKLSFEVTNDGQVPHALEIEGGGEEVETEVLQGGQSATLEADLEAGDYRWYCPVGNHADMGMEGTLTVE